MRQTPYGLLAEDYSDPEFYDALFDAYDDESEDDEAAPKRINPRARTPFVSRPTPNFRPSPALGSARVSAPGGAGGQVRFDRPVATAQAIEQLKAETRKAIAEVRAETKTNLSRLDDRLKSTATQMESLSKTVTSRVGGLEQKSQMMALLPMLQGKPKPTSITFKGVSAPIEVTDVKFAEDKNEMLLPLILMGGLGGSGGGSGDSSNMMLLAIALMK